MMSVSELKEEAPDIIPPYITIKLRGAGARHRLHSDWADLLLVLLHQAGEKKRRTQSCLGRVEDGKSLMSVVLLFPVTPTLS